MFTQRLLKTPGRALTCVILALALLCGWASTCVYKAPAISLTN